MHNTTSLLTMLETIVSSRRVVKRFSNYVWFSRCCEVFQDIVLETLGVDLLLHSFNSIMLSFFFFLDFLSLLVNYFSDFSNLIQPINFTISVLVVNLLLDSLSNRTDSNSFICLGLKWLYHITRDVFLVATAAFASLSSHLLFFSLLNLDWYIHALSF